MLYPQNCAIAFKGTINDRYKLLYAPVFTEIFDQNWYNKLDAPTDNNGEFIWEDKFKVQVCRWMLCVLIFAFLAAIQSMYCQNLLSPEMSFP